MPSGPGERYDFFLSRRGSVAAIAREVTDVLKEKGYKVRVEDYDFRLGASFIEAMHEAISELPRPDHPVYTMTIYSSPYTRKEFTSFEAQRLRKRGGAAHHHPALRGRARCEVCLPTWCIKTS